MTETTTKAHELECPACGSREVETSVSKQSYTAPFGDTKVFEVRLDTCRVCGESGDFAGTNSAIIRAAVEEADRQSIEKMLASLNQAGITTAYLERALSLPARTAARWKAGGASASGLALLRLVSAFPWLLEVAASRFAAPVAKRAIVSAAGAVIAEAFSNAGYQPRTVSAVQPAEGIFELTVSFDGPALCNQARALDSETGGTLTQSKAA